MRIGEQGGHNIPEMTTVPELPQWINDPTAQLLNEEAVNDKLLPVLAKRLLCDAYLCMYKSNDIQMYK